MLVGLYSDIQRSVSRVDPVIPTLIAAVIITLGSGVLALFDTGIGISVRDLTMAAISGGFALGVGLPLFNLGHRSVVAARIPLLLMTEVVLAPLWVWIWPGETPGVTTLIGGAVIMSVVAWLMLRARASELPRPVVAAT